MCNVIFGTLFIALTLCAIAFVATRTHMFHGAMMRRQQSVLNNEWLLQQCRSSEFYSNMKQHSTLCDDIVLEQTDALWLHALRDVIDQTYLCCDMPCINRVEQGLVWVFGKGVLLLAALADVTHTYMQDALKAAEGPVHPLMPIPHQTQIIPPSPIPLTAIIATPYTG